METYPHLLQTVLDATDVRAVAQFDRQLLGLTYRPGDEAPVATDGHVTADADDADWLVLTAADGSRMLAFQRVERLERTTWPAHEVPMQLHLDLTVRSREQLELQRDGPSRSARQCFGAESLRSTNRSTSSPTPSGTRSAFSSPDRPRHGSSGAA